jgi:branched-chain amino acid transport system substrate-binding protein
MKRYFTLFTLLLILSLVLVACGGDDEEPTAEPEQEAAPATEEPMAEEPAAYECMDAIGCVTIGPGDPLKLASLQAISGPPVNLGTDQVRAIEIALDDAGNEFRGHPITLQSEDDLCNAEGGTTGSQKILADPQVVAMLGTSCSGAGVPASEAFSDAGVLMISASNTAPSLTAVGYFSDAGPSAATAFSPGYFRTAHNDEFQGRAAANFALESLGVTKAATIHDGDPYTEGLANAFGESFAEFGGEWVLATAVNKGDTDMIPLLTSVVASGAEVVFYPIFEPEGGFITLQWEDVEGLEDVIKFGADGILSSTFLENIGESGNGMYFSGPGQPDTTAYADLLSKYEAKFGESVVQAFHARAYDATNMVLAAIDDVAVEDADGTLHIPRQALIDAMYATVGFEGLTGSLSCNKFGDCANPLISIMQIEDSAAGLAALFANVIEIIPFGEN